MYLDAGYRTADLLPAILGSLRGIPLKLVTALQRPGVKTDLSAVLATLKQHFGEVSSYYQLAQKLYDLKQGTTEEVSAYGPRVQSLVYEMGTLYPEQFPPVDLGRRAPESVLWGSQAVHPQRAPVHDGQRPSRGNHGPDHAGGGA